ncbi:DUF6350 family protein [Microbacterium sp. B2969]|uniref:DUF6350 family protein n=1 Tax=Microbacterium alkaliflavum TaxID=3248839 RepID=A0ABW7Q8H4_9MICO
MHRLIVAFLAAFDAAIAVAAGVAATLAPLTLVWVFGLGDGADWGALWPASAVVWQFGHLVPVDLTLPGEYLAATGMAESAASFTLSLAPLAFATFTAVFAARSGARASRADAWITGVLTGAVVVAALAALIALTSQNPVSLTHLWQAVLFPTLIFVVPAFGGAVATEWREASEGLVARARDRAEAARGGWGAVPGIAVRSSAAAVVGLVGVGALAVAVAVTLRAGQIVALYQAGNLDLLGVIVMTLAQLAYLPTLVVWGISFVAGPGFSLGAGTAVSPSGTQLGVVPGVPALGMIPESTSTWLLVIVLLPIAVGAFAGWVARSHLLAAAGFAPRPRGRFTAPAGGDAAPTTPSVSLDDVADESRRAALEALLSTGSGSEAAPAPANGTTGTALAEPRDEPSRDVVPHIVEPFLPRLVVTAAIAVVSAAAAALLAQFASGSLGPGRLAQVGPEPGPVALAVGLEVLVGASILLLAGRRDGDHGARAQDAGVVDTPAAAATLVGVPAVAPVDAEVSPPIVTPAELLTPEPAAAPDASEPAAAPDPEAPSAVPAPAVSEPPHDPDADTAPIELPTLPIAPLDRPDTSARRPPVD